MIVVNILLVIIMALDPDRANELIAQGWLIYNDVPGIGL